MYRPTLHLPRAAVALLLSVTLAAFTTAAAAQDPPGRVARLGYLSGEVSFSPAGEEEWDRAAINRPMGPGDRLWADDNGRAEIQLGTATLRMNGGTAVSVLNLDDQVTQLQLTEGSLHVRVRRLEPDEFVEVDTPHLAFTLRRPGAYRIDVDPNGDATTIRLRDGEGEVTGEGVSLLMQAPQVQRFTGDAARDDRYAAGPPPDDFDRWAADRDRAWDASVSARYVSPTVVGYQDLDDNGSWSVDASYGNVWYPRRVRAGWAPYRDGHWAWIDPWGWTWVDDAPWGYAVSHYGRWAHIRGRWGWVPGPVRVRAHYAPALVAFVGGDNFSLKISIGGGGGGIGWFPLGPREVYRPAYKVSAGYFERVNMSNTVVNKTVIKNVYVTKNVTNITYVNRRVPGAFVAVPQETFRNAQPVAKAVVKVDRRVIEGREVANTAAVAPTEKAVRGANAGASASGRPPAKAFARPVVARTEPPPPRLGFAAQQEKLAAQPGRPLDPDERRQLRSLPAAAAAASAARAPVKVVRRSADNPRPPAASARASEAGDSPDAREAAQAAPGPRRGASDPERRAARGDDAAPARRRAASDPGAQAAGDREPPARASAAERRASAAEARAQRARARDAAAPPEAPGAAAPAADNETPRQTTRAAERAARAASAAEVRRAQRQPASEAVQGARDRTAGADAAARESAAAAAPDRAAAPPRSAEERAARKAEPAARRGEEPASGPRGKGRNEE